MRGATLLLNAGVLTPTEQLPATPVLIDRGRIVAMGDAAQVEHAERVDLSGYTLAPGFIDIHVHGGGGHSIVDARPDQLEAYARWVTRFGVTGFLAGTIGSSPDNIARSLSRGADFVDVSTGGAIMLGYHLEGPFLSPRRCGAFNPAWLFPPNVATFTRFVEAANGGLRVMTIAPELAGASDVITEAVKLAVAPGLGHTDASYESMVDGFALGARHVTHCFNAMRPFSHRDPGPIAAALTSPGVRCEVIADGVHVAAGALKMLLAARGVRDTVLVTDGIELAGATLGSFGLAGHEVSIRGGRALTPNGTLAGSIGTMDGCVRNAARLAGASLLEAVRMATLNPAEAAGCAGDRGRIAPGFRADFVALTPDMRVAATWVSGTQVYGAGVQ